MSVERQSVKTMSQKETQRRQREANSLAKQQGSPLPYPNLWDALDPTKLPEGASTEEIAKRYSQFSKLCAPRPRKEHTI